MTAIDVTISQTMTKLTISVRNDGRGIPVQVCLQPEPEP